MKTWYWGLGLLMTVSACGAPADDIAQEIIAPRSPVTGKVVALKTSLSLKSGSLTDASQIWLVGGWTRGDAALCKPYAPEGWQTTEAYTRELYYLEKEKEQVYDLLLCASQLSDPKRIGAIGVVTASRKPDPIKP
jgi:hypothetical protein